MRRFNLFIQMISIGAFAALCFFAPPYLSYFLIALLFMRIIVFTRPTRGKKIADVRDPQTALLVIDAQEAMCGRQGMYPHREAFVRQANKIIDEARKQGQTVIYVCQEFQPFDFPFCFLTMGGCLLQGTQGARLASDLQTSDAGGAEIVIKHQQDAFTSKKLCEYLEQNSVQSVSIIGLDASACVFKTAVGAANRGYRVSVLRDAVLGKRMSAAQNALQKLSKKGISVC